MSVWNGVLRPAAPMGRKIGYARVSTVDQNLDRQIDALTNIECDEVFSDHGVSGKNHSRPGLDKAMATLRKDDMLIVYKLDRLGRSVTHLSQLLEHFEQNNIHFCSLTEGLDTSTSGGKMIYHIFAAVSQFHRDLIYENTMNGLEAARKRGRVGGRKFILSEDDVARAFVAIREGRQTCKEAAKALGVSRVTLQRAFHRYGYNWQLYI